MEPWQVFDERALRHPYRSINIKEIELQLANDICIWVIRKSGEAWLLVTIRCEAREDHFVEIVLVFFVFERVVPHSSQMIVPSCLKEDLVAVLFH